MTTATHSLDTSSATTTVAELLARNGAHTSPAPHRRSRVEAENGQFGGTLPRLPIPEPARPPLEDATIQIQYRYDESTVAALLAEPLAETAAVAEPPKEKSRAGRKIAGLAFAGAVLVGGWALASAQTPSHDGPVNAGPVPGHGSDPARDALSNLSAPVGGQVALLAAATPTGTAEIPAPASTAERQPDQGKISGTLPNTQKKTSAPATKKAAKPPAVMTKIPAQIPIPTGWPGSGGYPGQQNKGNHGKTHKPRH
ncbi:hypothetical protein [Amycolatopsis sp.]|uniref:hypothetical protein n=1 Tax=Amycolatopsis sp. TaxID=37632 RepID=UPI002C510389|nr:hypothetical protein [Amycolatopsis sp.]HVV11007.1 hypothetical protein [Amycolatopsis sp.]